MTHQKTPSMRTKKPDYQPAYKISAKIPSKISPVRNWHSKAKSNVRAKIAVANTSFDSRARPKSVVKKPREQSATKERVSKKEQWKGLFKSMQTREKTPLRDGNVKYFDGLDSTDLRKDKGPDK